MKFKRLLSAVLCVLMIASSLVFTASGFTVNESEIPNTLYKLTVDGNLSVGYIGGSVTDGFGATNSNTTSWRAITRDWFKTEFPDATITEISDAIGGTGMKYGLYRAEERYFKNGKAPDINFVEMAVNDQYDSLSGDLQYVYIESFIKKIYASNPKAEIIFVITGNHNYFDEEINSPATPAYPYGKAYTDLAGYYDIPVLYVFRDIVYDIYEEKGNQLISGVDDTAWLKYFTDTVHPSDLGYNHYANTIINYLEDQLGEERGVPSELVSKVLPETTYCEENNKGDLILDATVVGPTKFENQGMLSDFTIGRSTDGFDNLVSSAQGDTVMFKFNSDDLQLWAYTHAGIGESVSAPQTEVVYSIDGGAEKILNVSTTYQNHMLRTLAEDLPSAPASLGLQEGEHIIKLTHLDSNAKFDIRYFLMSDINGASAQMSVYTGTDPSLADKTITVSANPVNGGTVTVNGNSSSAVVENGTEVTVVATPAQGYDFLSWTENVEKVSTDLQYKFNATANRNLVANFEVSAVVTLPAAKGVSTIGKPSFYGRSFSIWTKTSNQLEIGTYGEQKYLYSSLKFDSNSTKAMENINIATGSLAAYSGDINATKTFAFVAKRNENFMDTLSATPSVLLRVIYSRIKDEAGVITSPGTTRPVFEKIEIAGADFDLWICKVGPNDNSDINFNYNNNGGDVAYVIYPYEYTDSAIATYFSQHPTESVLDFVGSAVYENVDYTYANSAYKAIYADIINRSALTTDTSTSNAYKVTYELPGGSTHVEYYPSAYQQNRTESHVNLPVADAFEKTTFNLLTSEVFGFLGWKKNGAGETFQGGAAQSIGTGSVTYVADVIEGNSVKFDAGKGSFEDGRKYVYKSVNIGGKVLENSPSDPTLAGFIFDGWVNSVTGENVTEDTVAENPYEIFEAQWTPIPGENYELSSLTIEGSKNDTINRKYVPNLDDYLGNAELNSENGITVKLPCGWPREAMPQLDATSNNGYITYTKPTTFDENGVAVGNIRIYNNNVVDQYGNPAPQHKDIIVRFVIEESSTENDITINDSFTEKFGMSGKGYTVEAADKNTAPANQIEGNPIKLTLKTNTNSPTNFTWVPTGEYLCVDDIKYVRVALYYDTGANGTVDTGIINSSISFATENSSGNLAQAASIDEAILNNFLYDRWQYVYYDLTGSYGYTDSLSIELFGGENANVYAGSDDSVYIAEVMFVSANNTEDKQRYKPTGIKVEYKNLKGILSNLTNDMRITTTPDVEDSWKPVQRYAQSIGGTYSDGVLSGLEGGTYYLKHYKLDNSFASSEAESFVIEQDKVTIKFHTENGELLEEVIADYSLEATTAFDYITLTKDGYTFLGWSTTESATEAEGIIPDADKSYYPVFVSINNVYVSADGSGDGMTINTPTSDFAAAWDLVRVSGGTITVIDTVNVSATALTATDKDIEISGGILNIPAAGMSFAQNSTGKVTFKNIELTGTGTISLNGKFAEFAETVSGAYTVCASDSVGTVGKLVVKGGEPTVNVVGSVRLVSSVAYTTAGDRLTGANVQLVSYQADADCNVELTDSAYKVTATGKYAVVTAIDGVKNENVELIENSRSFVLGDGTYTVSFYDTIEEVPVTVNIYDRTGHLETLSKVLGDTYSYAELISDVTIPEGMIFTGFEGDGYSLGLSEANTLSEMPEKANINLYATFEFDSEAPYWFTVGQYDEIRQLYIVDVKLAYADNIVSAGAIGFNVAGLTRTGNVVYNSLLTNIENIVYTNDNADVYVIAFSTESGTPIVAASEGTTIATMTFTLSPADYVAMSESAFTLYTLDNENALYNSTTDKWQIVSGTEENNIYAPKYIDSFVAPHEKGFAQYNPATIELTVELVGGNDSRTVTENIAKFGYRPHGDGNYTYVDLEVTGTTYSATEVYTISGIEDFVKGVAYDIIVVKNGYISAELENITVPDTAEVPAYKATLVIGDVTADGTVDENDLASIVTTFGGSATDEAKGQADINEDGFATVFDIAIVKDNYGKTGSTLLPC